MSKIIFGIVFLAIGCSQPNTTYDCGEIKLFANDISRYVVEGSIYEATIYWSGVSESEEVELFLDDNKLDRNGKGEFKLELLATLEGGESAGKGVVRKEYRLELKANGESVANKQFDYYVVKPALVINHLKGNPLLVNCQNRIQVDVPGLSGIYNPSYKVIGGEIIKNDKNEITLVPDLNIGQVELIVYNKEIEVGRKIFDVVNIPNLKIDLINESEMVKDILVSSNTHSMFVSVVSPLDFKTSFPNDDNFFVKRMKVLHYRSGILIQEEEVLGSEIQIRKLKPVIGDVVGVVVLEVVHSNFQDKEVSIELEKNVSLIMITD